MRVAIISKTAIIASPRTGSTTLANIFVSQGLSVCNEPFNRLLPVNYCFDLKNKGVLAVDELYGDYDVLKHLCGQCDFLVDRHICNNYKHIVLKRKNLIMCAVSFCFYILGKRNNVLGSFDFLLDCYKRVSVIESYNSGKVVYFEDLIGNDGIYEVSSIFEYCGYEIKDKTLLKLELDKGKSYHQMDREKCEMMLSDKNNSFYMSKLLEYING
jgi:hypothetical protein